MKKFIQKHSHVLHKLGLSLSFLCAVHCLAMPFILIAVPLMGTSFFNERVELLVIGLSLVIGFFVLLKDYKHHENKWPLGLLGFSFLIVLFFSLIIHNHLLLSLSSISMAVAYFYNWRLHRNMCSHS